MTQFADVAGGVVLAVAAVGGALVVLPRRQHEPIVLPVALDVPSNPVERAQRPDSLSDSERVEALQRQLGAIAAEQRSLTDVVKALSEAEKAQNSELERGGSRK